MPNTIKSAYTLCNNLTEAVWYVVQFWSVFAKTIVGNQLLNSLDNISINLAKAGKIKDSNRQILFLGDAAEYLIESFVWIDKARRRSLFSKEEYQTFYLQMEKLETLLDKKRKRK
ncbi:MAG: four helix bundle protein [Patescibacteria group bacterium]|jgi:four helix bundle protein